MTTKTRVLTDAERTYYDCPDWCTRWDHDADQEEPGKAYAHFAEDIGACGPQSVDGRPGVYVHLDGEALYVEDADELDRVAGDMVKAAQWLRAHR